MFNLSAIQYVKYGVLALSLLFCTYIGYSFEHNRFMAFKAQVEAVARTQEAKVESIQKQQALVTKGIENEYQAKIAAIKSYYGGLHNTSSGKLPSISNPANGVNESATDQLLACAYTTQQLVSLQDWIKGQVGIK